MTISASVPRQLSSANLIRGISNLMFLIGPATSELSGFRPQSRREEKVAAQEGKATKPAVSDTKPLMEVLDAQRLLLF